MVGDLASSWPSSKLATKPARCRPAPVQVRPAGGPSRHLLEGREEPQPISSGGKRRERRQLSPSSRSLRFLMAGAIRLGGTRALSTACIAVAGRTAWIRFNDRPLGALFLGVDVLQPAVRHRSANGEQLDALSEENELPGSRPTSRATPRRSRRPAGPQPGDARRRVPTPSCPRPKRRPTGTTRPSSTGLSSSVPMASHLAPSGLSPRRRRGRRPLSGRWREHLRPRRSWSSSVRSVRPTPTGEHHRSRSNVVDLGSHRFRPARWRGRARRSR